MEILRWCQIVYEKQHLPESSPGRILRNKVREHSSRYRGEVRADAELKKEDKK